MDRSKKINRSLGLSQDNMFRKLYRIANFFLELIFVRLYNKFSRNSENIPAQFHSLYYYEELTMKEIDAVLGIAESRVS